MTPAPASSLSPTRTIGYLVPEFPGQTHVFFWREIQAIERSHVGVKLFSTRRPTEGACGHDFAAEGLARTTYIFPPSVADALSLLGSPSRLLAAFHYVRGLKESSLKAKLKIAALAVCAQRLIRSCQAEGVDHVHGHSCADTAHVLAMARAMGGPAYSLMLHGDLAIYGRDHKAKCEHASFIMTAGPHLVPQLTAAGLGIGKTVPSCMGLDTDRITPATSVEPHPELRVLTVARLNLCKGHLFAFKALARVKAQGVVVRYTVAGSGPDEAEIRQQAMDVGVADLVDFIGSLSESQVIEQLHKADVFVLSSVGWGEAWPVSVMEAMSAGVPVVCSRIGSTPYMVEDGVDSFLIDQEDFATLADRLISLATDPALRERISRAARQRALREFDVRATSGLLLSRIDSALAPIMAEHSTIAGNHG